jgi:CIC family chloride channel protein
VIETETITRHTRRGILQNPFLRKYLPLVHEDLTAVYSRDLKKWLLIAPLIGVITGLTATAIVIIILNKMWPTLLGFFLDHHWAIVPVMFGGFALAGLIMQYFTPDPDEHSTEEVIKSYHEHQGDINMRPFFAKLIAAIATVGVGGSAALEGPGIYSGGAIGSWLWAKLKRLRLDSRDRRIMLICGAAAGMSAVFRAPLTGIAFALEMPYRDDLAHEALVPSLIASVVAFVTLGAFLGTQPLFNFEASQHFTDHDLYWSALIGLVIGLIGMAFAVTFRRARRFFIQWSVPHWAKLAVGGTLTGLCGLLFLAMYHGTLVPLGPNYDAIGQILTSHHRTSELLSFAGLKLAATVFTLGSGGVSAMFVPLCLSGGALGTAFAQAFLHSHSVELFAAVGMASLISSAYKTPLAAVVFVAEATGGHGFIIPALIGAAVAYLVSGDASASGDQRLHEEVKLRDLSGIPVSEVMQRQLVSVQASLTLNEFAGSLTPHSRHEAFPVFDGAQLLGAISIWSMVRVPSEEWNTTTVRDLIDPRIHTIAPDCDVSEAARLLLSEHKQPMLLVVSDDRQMKGILTKTDILQTLKLRRDVPLELSSVLAE